MNPTIFKLDGIPAALWGPPSDAVILAVHGNLSHKTDVPIALLAEHALPRGFQVLSFDLPEHGERKTEGTLCKVQTCVPELQTVMQYARACWPHVRLFANSLGAYFSLLAYRTEPIESAWFLSPVVDMRRIIENMMGWFGVSRTRLETEQTVATPIGQTLYWDYYCYVCAHPVADWPVPTRILYGEKDDLCEPDVVRAFADRFACALTIVPDAEHYFHTPAQLEALEAWLNACLGEVQS